MPASNTYESISSVTLSNDSSTVTFGSIPSTYTDLILVTSVIRTATDNMAARFNSDSGSNYSLTYLSGNGSSANSGRLSNQTVAYIDAGNSGTTNFGVGIFHIMNYSNTTTNKTTISRSSYTDRETNFYVNLWRSTNAINSIQLFNVSGNLRSGSTFSLYGIKAA